MSMYTELLDAAFAQRASVLVRPTRYSVLHAARCRVAIEEGLPTRTGAAAVPVVLAREVGDDVALLELAGLLGIETDPACFEPARHERARLELAFRDRGITLDTTTALQEPAARRA